MLAIGLEELYLIKGTPLDDQTRTFVRKGLWDSLTRDPKTSQGLLEKAMFYGKHRHISTFAINERHFINRVRIGKWARIIDHCK